MAVDLTAVKAYLGTAATQWADPELTRTLAVETLAQSRRLRVPSPRPADLDEALLRRVSRNLALRKLPLGIAVSEIEATRVGARDPEITRLEGPYKLKLGSNVA